MLSCYNKNIKNIFKKGVEKPMRNKLIKSFFAVMAFAILTCASVFANPVVVDYYYGEGCGYCERLKPWLVEFENQHKEDVKINWNEIWNNDDNNKKFQSEMTKFDVPQEERGTPTAVVNNKVIIGSKNIHDQLEEEVKNAQTNPNKEIVKYVAPVKQKNASESLPKVTNPKVQQNDDSACLKKVVEGLNIGILSILTISTLSSLGYIVYLQNKVKKDKENK